MNTVANYAIISQADNAELTGRDPFDVWRSLKPNQREWASTQLFFIAHRILKAYDEFIEFRAEKLADALNDFVGLGERRAGGQAQAGPSLGLGRPSAPNRGGSRDP